MTKPANHCFHVALYYSNRELSEKRHSARMLLTKAWAYYFNLASIGEARFF